MNFSTLKIALLNALKALVSFRVIMALTTSASVTAAVAGPMAYEASKARDVAAVTVPTSTTTTTKKRVEPPATVTTSPSSTQPATTATTSTTSTVPGATTTTTLPELTDTGLYVSVSADHADPTPLEGSKVFGVVFPFFDGPGVTSVRFWLDDPNAAGAPTRQSSTAPFDFNSAGVNVTKLGVGTHTILVEVTTTTAKYRRLAQFEVTNRPG